MRAALHSPLLETSPEGAKAVLLGITGTRDLKMAEVNDAAKIVEQTADPATPLAEPRAEVNWLAPTECRDQAGLLHPT